MGRVKDHLSLFFLPLVLCQYGRVVKAIDLNGFHPHRDLLGSPAHVRTVLLTLLFFIFNFS